MSDLRHDLERLGDQVSELLIENESLEAEVGELKGEVSDLERRLESVETSRDEFKNDLEVKSDEYERLEQEHTELEQDTLPLLTLYDVVSRNSACRSAFDNLLMAVKLAAKKEEWDEINGL